jgi:hypothetical protein
MNQGSEEWKFDEAAKVIVPYRLPEQGMNF